MRAPVSTNMSTNDMGWTPASMEKKGKASTKDSGPRHHSRRDRHSSPSTSKSSKSVYIVGMSVIFPGGDTLEALWDTLNAMVPCPVDTPVLPEPASGNLFVGMHSEYKLPMRIPPAMDKDPFFRLTISLMLRCLENAGKPAMSLKGSCCGVFWGGKPSPAVSESTAKYSTLLAQLLGWRGQCNDSNSYCVSSHEALNLACSRTSSWAPAAMVVSLAGSITGDVPKKQFGDFRILSKLGKVQPFGKTRDGTLPGEFGGAILLTKKECLPDFERPFAYVCSTAMGVSAANMFRAHHPDDQVEVIERALTLAGIKASDISLVEANSLGTKMGDEMEYKSLQRVFDSPAVTEERLPTSRVLLGTHAPVMGHPLAATGMLQVIKCVLSLQHHTLPPNILGYVMDPNNSFGPDSGVLLSEKPENIGDGAYASVHAYSASGDIGHVILKAYGKRKDGRPKRRSLSPGSRTPRDRD